MNKYIFVRQLSASEAWSLICDFIISQKQFHSITGILYSASIKNDYLYYEGGSRTVPNEHITKADFTTAYNILCKLQYVNTSIIKRYLPNPLYRKRTPLIGILLSTKIVAKE